MSKYSLAHYTSVSFGNTLDGSSFYELIGHDTLTQATECTDHNAIREGFRGFVIIKSHKGSWVYIRRENIYLIDIDLDSALSRASKTLHTVKV
jgi:hypothetical protein